LYNLSEPIFITYPLVSILCNGIQVDNEYVNDYGPYQTIDALVTALNANLGTNSFGTYSNVGGGNIQLIMPLSVVNSLCPTGVLSFKVIGF
jgi:hypothetical protein